MVRSGDALRVLELQVLTADDWPLWRQLRLAALADAPYAFGSTLEDWRDQPEQRWRDRLGGETHDVVARLGELGLVGMVSGVRPDDTGVAELISMWVAPAARGRHVGDALLHHVMDWARGAGAHTLALDVVVANGPAVALYRRHGFVESGPVAEPDPAKPEVRMQRALG